MGTKNAVSEAALSLVRLVPFPADRQYGGQEDGVLWCVHSGGHAGSPVRSHDGCVCDVDHADGY